MGRVAEDDDDDVSLSMALDIKRDVVRSEMWASGLVESSWKVMDFSLLKEVKNLSPNNLELLAVALGAVESASVEVDSDGNATVICGIFVWVSRVVNDTGLVLAISFASFVSGCAFIIVTVAGNGFESAVVDLYVLVVTTGIK